MAISQRSRRRAGARPSRGPKAGGGAGRPRANVERPSGGPPLARAPDVAARGSLPRVRDATALGDVPFRVLVEQVQEYAIFLLDRAGRVVSWNAGAERLKGYRADEILGRHFSVFYSAAEVEAGVPDEELRVAERSGSVELEGWRVRKDGSSFLANVVLTALRDEPGRLIGFAKVTRDVTARFTSAERALTQSEETLRLATQATGLGVWSWNLESGALSWTLPCKAMFGLPANEPVTLERFYQAVHPDDRAHCRAAVDRALEADASGTYSIELRARWPDGTVRWIVCHGQVLFEYVHGRRIARRFAGTALDVTERKTREFERERLVRELDEAVRARDDFVAVLSHDLRNPIGAIALGAELLAKQLPDEVGAPREVVNMIRRAAGRSSQMLGDLLEEISLQGGRVELALQAHEVGSLLAEVEVMWRPAASQQRVALSIEVSGAPRLVRCDRPRLLRVFGNLLGNALKFTPEHGTISIRAADDGDAVRFAVTDTGPGIAAEDVARLFEKWFRAGRRGVGLGLGLSIAKSIVEAHGGTIGVESEPGRGSTFWFRIPSVRAG